ncbi:hypothetical protein AALP_AAs60104U000600 [Arabis alpina]|nr:hypothetical protein AALP_AAs60104U000600 [Arabis alpina]
MTVSSGTDVAMVPSGTTGVAATSGSGHLAKTVDFEVFGREESPTVLTLGGEVLVSLIRRVGDPRFSLELAEDPANPRAEGRLFVDSLLVNDESPNLPPGKADASSASSSFDSQVSSDKSDDEDMFVEVEQTKKAKKAKKKGKVKVRPDPPGSSLSISVGWFVSML